jgi:hypothetical protein
MQTIASLEQSILENLRQLPLEKQQEVLDFSEFLKQRLTSVPEAHQSSLRAIAAMSLAERHKILAPSMAATAHDFLTNPEMTEFSVLDTEDWEPEHA